VRSKHKEAEIVLLARDRNTEATLKHKEAEIPREQNRYGKTEEVGNMEATRKDQRPQEKANPLTKKRADNSAPTESLNNS